MLISKEGLLLEQEPEVSGLINIQLGRQPRPGGVIHPDACDAVAVGDELTWSTTDNRSIAAIQAHAGEVADQQFTDPIGVDQ